MAHSPRYAGLVLLAYHHAPSAARAIHTRSSGKDHSPCQDELRAAIALPDGQLTHSLLHTFASHFMMAGRNILTLQKILGHSNLTMTIRYAHLAPDHLQEAKEFNPLALLSRANAVPPIADNQRM